MLHRVPVGHKSLADYHSLAGRQLAAEINELASALQGMRVLHLSATAFGGGVAEILYTLVPLMRDVGLETDWRVIFGRDEFFDATKATHNALQGDPVALSAAQREVFRHYNAAERGRAARRDRRVRLRDRPRSAAGVRARAAARGARALDLALPHRHLDAEPRGARLPAARDPRLRRCDLPHGRVRPGRHGAPAGRDPATRDRPAGSQEHGARRAGRGVHRRPVRRRPGAAAAAAGLALRPVEGSARRHRCLPDGQGAASRSPARPRRLDGARRSRGLRVLPADARPRGRGSRHPDPLEPEQRRRRRGQRVPGASPTSCCRNRSARVSG